MLYAAGVPSREAMKTQPHVGVASVWWEGNPCKYVLLFLPCRVRGIDDLAVCTVSHYIREARNSSLVRQR